MQDSIVIKGAREHNLKNIDVSIPRDKLVVITGLSGSGKSSLAFDTIYAEGQRRYVESLSSYARQFLGQMDKPDLDSIDGLSPAVSIDQKTTSKNPRSTVGTVTEIYDYLRLLFARVGIPHCPECGREIKRQTTDQIVDMLLEWGLDRRALILAPVVRGRKGEYGKMLADLRKEGFARVRIEGEVRGLDEEIVLDKKFKHNIDVVVDRLILKPEATSRLTEAVETATRLAEGNLVVQLMAEGQPLQLNAAVDTEQSGDVAHLDSSEQVPYRPETEESFSLALACPVHGHSMDELAPRDFSFNAPYGACPECLGLGFTREVDPSLLIPNPSLSLAAGACATISMSSNYYPQILAAVADYLGVSLDTPWEDYPSEVQKAFLDGLGATKIRINYVTRDGRDTHWTYKWSGLLGVAMERYQDTSSESMKQKLEEFMSVRPCRVCGGARLKPEILAVTVGGLNINQVTRLSAIDELRYFEELELSEREQRIAERIIKEIKERLRFLVDVGLDYLTLERATATLSGGEAQRIRLATQIGAGLMGVLYILDEPSIGLHQRDNARLIATLERLRDLGNTVI
ncbi:MAG: excinuclease ABC subunit UvrA, partial [Coriobacteriaceae bacterium]|nr:excinuclease ABC subunit UvrA [Coriobacteriaceae bacterium]